MEKIKKSGERNGLKYVLGVDREGDDFIAVRVPAGHPWEGVDDLWRVDPQSDIGTDSPFWDSGGWWAVQCNPIYDEHDAMRLAGELAERVNRARQTASATHGPCPECGTSSQRGGSIGESWVDCPTHGRVQT